MARSELNRIEFSDGINLIIAKNGNGKSKLWNAFYWVLYDAIFDSDKRAFLHTRKCSESIISDKAKAECAVSKTVSVGVTLEVEDSRGERFDISRTLHFVKNDEDSWLPKGDSDVCSYCNIRETMPEMVKRSEYNSILQRVLPGNLKPYMWFQGEQVDRLDRF